MSMNSIFVSDNYYRVWRRWRCFDPPPPALFRTRSVNTLTMTLSSPHHHLAISQCCFKEVERSSILGSNLAQLHESGTSVVFLTTDTFPPTPAGVITTDTSNPYRYGFSWSPCWPWTSVLLHSGLRKSWPASQYQVGDWLSNLLQSRLRQYGFVGVRALSRARRSVFLKEFVKTL